MAQLNPRECLLNQPDRHKSMSHCLDWSFNLLEQEYQDGFVRLGLFAHGFTSESVSKACGVDDSDMLLDRLNDAALIWPADEIDDKFTRYTMHRFTREYLSGKCRALSNISDIYNQYVNYYKLLLEENGGEENLYNKDKRVMQTASAFYSAENFNSNQCRIE